jgi:hypothetical protein
MKHRKKVLSSLIISLVLSANIQTSFAAEQLPIPTNIITVQEFRDLDYYTLKWENADLNNTEKYEVGFYLIDSEGNSYRSGGQICDEASLVFNESIYSTFDYAYSKYGFTRGSVREAVTVKAISNNPNQYGDSEESDYFFFNFDGGLTGESFEKLEEGTYGKCGPDASWAVSKDNILTISGTGVVNDFSEITDNYGYSYSFKEVIFENGITELDDFFIPFADKFTFANTITKINCSADTPTCGTIVIPESVEYIDSTFFDFKTLKALYMYSKNCFVGISGKSAFDTNGEDAEKKTVIYAYRDSDTYRRIKDADNNSRDLLHPNNFILMDIEKTTDYYRNIADSKYEEAVKMACDSGVIRQIYDNYGKNLTRGEFAKAIAKYELVGAQHHCDLEPFTDTVQGTGLNIVAHYINSDRARLGKEGFTDTFGVNEEITLGEFLDEFCLLFYHDFTGYYNPDTKEYSLSDSYDCAVKNSLLKGLEHLSAESKIKYEEAAQIFYNDNYQTFNKAMTDDVTYRENIKNYAVEPWEIPDYNPVSPVYEKSISLGIGKNTVNTNGVEIETDASPIIRNDRTMVPIRVISENLDATVSWDGSTQTVTIIKGITTIEIKIGSNVAYINSEEKTLDSPAFIENDRTYVPVRFISEAFGAKVEWDAETQTVTIQA